MNLRWRRKKGDEKNVPGEAWGEKSNFPLALGTNLCALMYKFVVVLRRMYLVLAQPYFY